MSEATYTTAINYVATHPETVGGGAYRSRFCTAHYTRWLYAGGNPVGWELMNVPPAQRLAHPEQSDCDVAGCHLRAGYQEYMTHN